MTPDIQRTLQRRVVDQEECRLELPVPEGGDPLVIRIAGGLPSEAQHAQICARGGVHTVLRREPGLGSRWRRSRRGWSDWRWIGTRW
jgi:hypothetical protein